MKFTHLISCHVPQSGDYPPSRQVCVAHSRAYGAAKAVQRLHTWVLYICSCFHLRASYLDNSCGAIDGCGFWLSAIDDRLSSPSPVDSLPSVVENEYALKYTLKPVWPIGLQWFLPWPVRGMPLPVRVSTQFRFHSSLHYSQYATAMGLAGLSTVLVFNRLRGLRFAAREFESV